MEETEKKTKSWSLGTFVRVSPNVKNSKSVVQYAHQDIHGRNRGVLQIKIPDDADPGVAHNNASGILEYEFDKIFSGDTSQDVIFESIAKDKVMDTFNGINSTIFAYGQTGSGKTYTIFGGESFSDRGLIPRSISLLFKEIRVKEQNNFVVKCQISFTEVYKETVYDLLDKKKENLPIGQWTAVQVLEGESGLTLRNLNVFEVTSEDDALSLFFLGNNNRITSSTAMNEASSRSHAIFTMIIESKGVKDGKTFFTSGKMNFVDLAGSERIYKIPSTGSKEIIEEAKYINLSLHYLENVIVSLRDQSMNVPSGSQEKNSKLNGLGHGHVPYRNCILTSILRDSLGGNCRSGFILTLSMDRQHFEESVSTCRFGQRCGETKVMVHANTEVSLFDQVKVLNVTVRQLEKQIHTLEEEKNAIAAELKASKEYWRQVWEPRTLSSQEKTNCKQCVQILFASAKESLALHRTATASAEDSSRVFSTRINMGSKEADPKELGTQQSNQKDSLVSEIEHKTAAEKAPQPPDTDALIAQSRDELYMSVEKMDRAVLIELSIALGGLVQTMYIEREKAKAEDSRKSIKKAEILAMNEAKLKAKQDIEEEKKTRNLAARLDMEHKAQRDAQETESMLARLGAQSMSRCTSLPIRRAQSIRTTTDGDNKGASVTVRDRLDFGLSKESLTLLVTGSNFYVFNFLGLKALKFYFVTTDIANIACRSSKGNHVKLTPFERFEMAEMTKNTITLKAKAGQKSLHLEFPAPDSESQSDALVWYNSLSVCIDRANGRNRLS